MSTYAGSQALLAKRRLELVKLAAANDWRITALYCGLDTPCISATRGDALLDIWLSKAGAVLDVHLKVPNGQHFTDNGRPIYRHVNGRGRAAAERVLTSELTHPPIGVL